MGGLMTHEEPVATPVVLHVYDLGFGGEVQALNAILEKFGTGAFHCGVEIFGIEWSFQHKAKGTGVLHCDPKVCPQHTYRKSVDMGCTMKSSAEVHRLMQCLKREWPGSCYDVLTKNCCHFCDELCVRLGVGHIPWWATSLAGAGARVKSIYTGVAETLHHPTLLMDYMGGGRSMGASRPPLKEDSRQRQGQGEQRDGANAAAHGGKLVRGAR